MIAMKTMQKKAARQVTLIFSKEVDKLEEIRTEISSCLATGDNLWVSCDEGATIERLSRNDEGNYDNHKQYQLGDFFDMPEEGGETDMEALAYQEPYLWFCGSMSLKRDSADPDDSLEEQLEDLLDIDLDENRFSLGCIPCIEKGGEYELHKEIDHEGKQLKAKMLRGGAKSSMLHNALMNDEHLGMFMKVPCKDNGFDIEGLAVENDRIFIGLRGPVISGFAVLLEIDCDALDGELLMRQKEGEELLYRKHFLDLAGMGIRELNIDKKGDLYLLAGPTMDLDGTISIYRIRGGLKDQYASVVHDAERLFDVARGATLEHGIEKAEGMAMLDGQEILITYDTPSDERLLNDNQLQVDVFELK
jgi:hypothetical protein